MRNNKGLSLIEVIVVIAIIAIVGGIAIFSASSLGNSKLNSAVEHLQSELVETKSQALSKPNGAELRIKNVNGVLCFVDASDNILQRFSDKKCTLSYEQASGTPSVLNNGEVIVISFNRSSGAFLDTKFPDGSAGECKALILERNGKSRKMNLVKATGKFYFD